jgi:hypothetical protein
MSKTVSQLPVSSSINPDDWVLTANANNPDTLERVLASKFGAMTKTQKTLFKLILKRGF